jgi:hypothetical protein
MTTSTTEREGGELPADPSALDDRDVAWADGDQFADLDLHPLHWRAAATNPDAVADAWATLLESGIDVTVKDAERYGDLLAELCEELEVKYAVLAGRFPAASPEDVDDVMAELLLVHDDVPAPGVELAAPRPVRRRSVRRGAAR